MVTHSFSGRAHTAFSSCYADPVTLFDTDLPENQQSEYLDKLPNPHRLFLSIQLTPLRLRPTEPKHRKSFCPNDAQFFKSGANKKQLVLHFSSVLNINAFKVDKNKSKLSFMGSRMSKIVCVVRAFYFHLHTALHNTYFSKANIFFSLIITIFITQRRSPQILRKRGHVFIINKVFWNGPCHQTITGIRHFAMNFYFSFACSVTCMRIPIVKTPTSSQ